MKTLSLCIVPACLAVLTRPSVADDKMDIGGFAGAHIFSRHLELGTRDAASQDTPRNSGAFGIRVSYRFTDHLRAEGELAIVPTVSRIERDDITVFGWRTHLVFDLLPLERLDVFGVAGIGALTGAPVATEKIDEDTDLATHLGVGAQFRAGDNWGLRMDVRAVLAPSTASKYLTTDAEFFFGLYKSFPTPAAPPPVDSDGDGVYDPDDKCPDSIEDQDGFRDEDGCADPDNDEDGVDDEDDQCPGDAESMNGIDDDDGCPEPDGDGDGILGSRDQCPQEAEDMDGVDDDDGCPDADPPPPDDSTPDAVTPLP